jgi:hypothetical protein
MIICIHIGIFKLHALIPKCFRTFYDSPSFLSDATGESESLSEAETVFVIPGHLTLTMKQMVTIYINLYMNICIYICIHV